ncbi:25180_t:CDS:2, partial [Gigaspora margarita]
FTKTVKESLKDKELLRAEEIDLEEKLSKQWNRIEQAIKKVADENIPKTKVTPKTFYTFSKKAMKLYSALRRINTVIINLQKGKVQQDLKEEINQEIKKVSKMSQLGIDMQIRENKTDMKLNKKIKDFIN